LSVVPTPEDAGIVNFGVAAH